MAKDFSYYFAQLRRTEEHREQQAEKEIRKLYKELLADTKQFVAEEYYKLAEDGKLTYEILRSKGQNARFLEEVEQRLNDVSPKVSQEIQKAVEDMYELAYTSMVNAVKKATSKEELAETLKGLRVSPDMVQAVVENPIAGLTLKDTLEKNRKNIIWDIKREIGIGLTVGDRYETMAKRIAKSLDGDYKKAVTIARTETGRVQEAGHLHSAKDINEALKGGTTNQRLVKTWKTMKDGRVRDQHSSMNGVMVGVDEDFTLPDGTKTQAPKQSGVASQDINCRCFAKYDLQEDYGSAAYREIGKPYSLEASPSDKLTVQEYSKAKKELEKASGKAFADEEVKAMLDAVNEYTGVDYMNILAAGSDFKGIYGDYTKLMSAEQKEIAKAMYDNVEKYLENAPKYNGTAYRALGFDIGGYSDDGSFDKLMKELENGEFEAPSLTSWTKKKTYLDNVFDARTGLDDEAEAIAKVTFIVEDSEQGVNIKDYARIKGQDEILFSKNVKFDVVDLKKDSYIDDDDIEQIKVVVKLKEKKPKE